MERKSPRERKHYACGENYILNDEYDISERMLLEVRIQPSGKEEIFYALNDVVVDHGPSARRSTLLDEAGFKDEGERSETARNAHPHKEPSESEEPSCSQPLPAAAQPF